MRFVGPDLKNNGQDDATWSDHTDVRPTMLSLIGLQDSYVHDGRVLTETIASGDAGNDAVYTALSNKMLNWTSQ